MNTESLACAIVGHLVGDYLLQNDMLSDRKKKCSATCLLHCALWAAAVLIFSGWIALPQPKFYIVSSILVITHFVQDRWNLISKWMELIGQTKFRTGQCSPWSVIVVDNVWHIVTIWAVWRFVV